MTLSLLSILIGVGASLPEIYGLARPAGLAARARQFPRNLPIGVVLMLLATGWFLYILNEEPIADFTIYKPYMLAGFGAVGVLSCIFVQDFLAVRALAVLLLLLAKTMVDIGRPHLGETPLVVVFQGLAYVYVVVGIWLTVSPWRLRDWLNWFTANESLIRATCAVRLALSLFFVGLGLTAFRGL